MKIGCLQFAPQVGDVDNNISKAEAILDSVDPKNLDLLVLPELAFSGYNFKSLDDISPFWEKAENGVSCSWARSTAVERGCAVVVGYPEDGGYNSAVVVSGEEVLVNYRKTHLYYTDETWAKEGTGFYSGYLPGLGRTALGICMDINPYKFEAPWDEFEFARHAMDAGARLIIISMAWLTNDDPGEFCATPTEPDADTLSYWVARLQPLVRAGAEEEVIVVCANRCGTEGEATYAGTSAVLGIQRGEVWVYGILGRGSSEVLVVDTDEGPCAKLIFRSRADVRDGELGVEGS